jgi:hypothetical protein
MAGKAKGYLTLCIVLIGVSMLAAGNRGGRPPIPQRPGASPAEADPYQNRAVLVEAFVVEVPLSALYEMNMSPLGQAPRSVSVENILECLRPDGAAHVIVGAKTAAGHGSNRNTGERSETAYYPRQRIQRTGEGKKETIDHVAYKNGETLGIAPVIVDEHTVSLNYSFNYSGPREGGPKGDVPLDTVSWSWSGNVSVPAGTPRIVGATQDRKAAILFILTAHILD